MTTATEQLIDVANALQAHLTEVQEGLQRDRDRRAAKEARIVEVAHEEATANGIGEAADELLEEFGLPGRPITTSLLLDAHFTERFEDYRYSMRLNEQNSPRPFIDSTGASSGWSGRRDFVTLNWMTGWSLNIETPRSVGRPECVCPETDDDGFITEEGFITEDIPVDLTTLPARVSVRLHVHNCGGENCRNR